MYVIGARNVNDAAIMGMRRLLEHGYRNESRNGDVIVFPTPVSTAYARPRERVLFWPERDANPFFHLFESLWMLGGRNDVEYPARYVKRMRSFSDDGVALHGAYGHRWRAHFGFDQLDVIVERLREKPEDRRATLSMWDAASDLGVDSKDVPCNLQAVFNVTPDHHLHMTVFCRSNDILWGCYGANAVHFSVLHEYVATRVGCPVGQYWQVSVNFHLYASQLEKARAIAELERPNPYTVEGPTRVNPTKLICGDVLQWHHELTTFLEAPDSQIFTDRFFRRVALPMHWAHAAHKMKDRQAAQQALDAGDPHSDWIVAAKQWLARRWEDN